MGGGRRVQPRGVRGGAGAVLCGLGAPDWREFRECPRLSAAAAPATVLRARGGRGASLSALLPAGRAGPGLSPDNPDQLCRAQLVLELIHAALNRGLVGPPA